MPIDLAASYCPLGKDCSPPLTTSATYADSKIAIPIATLSNLSTSVPDGNNKGNITAAANKTVIRGIPLHVSIKQMQKYLMIGISDLLPIARRTPKGKDRIIPKIARINVKASPPHSLVSTIVSPKPPRIRINAIKGKIKIKKIKYIICIFL